MSSCSRARTWGLTSRSRNRPTLSRISLSCSASALIWTCPIALRDPAGFSAGFDRQRDKPDIAFALFDADQHPFLIGLLCRGGELRHLFEAGERRLSDADDEIAGAQPLCRGGAVGRHLGNNQPLGPVRQ